MPRLLLILLLAWLTLTTRTTQAFPLSPRAHVGLRSSVTSPGDTRTFTYYHLQPQGETHTGGVWNGWSVEQVPDAQDRVGTIRISLGGAVVREFGLQYDGAARLQQSSSPEVTGTYGYGGMGAVGSLDRQVAGGGLYHTAWSYDAGTGWLTELNHQGSEFHYTYPGRDARGRLTAWTGPGAQWSDGSYDGIDQVQGFTRAGLEPFSYGYDARGNRLTQAGATQSGINLLDQVMARQMTSQRIGVSGTVTAGSGTAVQIVDNDGALDDTPANVNRQTGEYLWTKDLGGLASGGQRLDLIVRATKAGAGTNGTDAVAERKVSVALAAASEAFIYDGAGRLTDDGFWHYTWDGASRLTHLECKIASLIEPGAQSETLDFTYDADGRRLQKTRTVAYADGRLNKTETSQMLWVNWLPVMEIRAGFANHNGRRWFQWGADLSGTREGAGGIGGLVAIIEESTPGRVYLPMHDGLGNVTGLLDAGTGAVVARYDYGPYGEPLSASGDTEACPFRWQTKLYDAERQQYYFGYRHYDPRTGRWLSRDPLAEAGGLNLYAYCDNDPVNKHDPLGLADELSVADARYVETLQLAARLAENPTDQFLLQYQAEHTTIRHLTDGEPWALSIYQNGGAAGLAKYVATRDESLRMAGAMSAGAIKMAGGIAGMGASGFAEGSSFGLSSPVAVPAFAGSVGLFANGIRQALGGGSVTLGGQLTMMGADPEAAAGFEFMLDGSMMLAPGNFLRPTITKTGTVRIAPYGTLVEELKDTGLQANHLNQKAAFPIIPESEGLAVGMRGNAFTEIGSPHYEFHLSLEEFWKPYRKGGNLFGQVPTSAEYGTAMEKALIRAGYTPGEVAIIARQAAAQRAAFGLAPSEMNSQPAGAVPSGSKIKTHA